MQLLRPAVNINEQKVIQKKALDKVILVKPLLVGNQKVLYLERRYFPHNIGVLVGSRRHKHILELLLVKNFKVLTAPYFL